MLENLGYGDRLWGFFLKIFQNHQWFLADFFDNCYTKCCKFRIKISIFLTLNKLYSSRSFAFCFYKKYFRCVTLWSTISLAWLGVVDKLPFPLHPSVCFVTLSQFHFRSHSCGFRLRLSWDFLKYGCLRPKWTSNYLSIWSLQQKVLRLLVKAFHFFWKSSAVVVHNGADDSGTKVSKYLIYFAFNFMF